MNEKDFYNNFYFSLLRFQKYHCTDQTNTNCPLHYFGCIRKGKGKITTKDTCLNLSAGEIFYIPKGLKYRAEWFVEPDEPDSIVELYSFGFIISPIEKKFALQKINCAKKSLELFFILFFVIFVHR